MFFTNCRRLEKGPIKKVAENSGKKRSPEKWNNVLEADREVVDTTETKQTEHFSDDTKWVFSAKHVEEPSWLAGKQPLDEMPINVLIAIRSIQKPDTIPFDWQFHNQREAMTFANAKAL